MNFILQRYSNVSANGGSTQGILMEKTLDNPFICHCIEDEKREVKVVGETRIPARFYELKIWNDGQNPNQWVLDHRVKYNLNGDNWFEFPIQLKDVPGFDGVLIHVGYGEKDTDGCLLLTDTIGNNSVNRLISPNALGAYSIDAVRRFYLKAYPILKSGGKVFLEVRDENFLIK